MPTIDITDDHRDRIETLREELTATNAGPYASVDTDDTLAYLLDLAETVDDPDRTADPDALVGDATGARPSDGPETGDDAPPFDRDHARRSLESRPRRHSDPDAADGPDLYDIAAAFDVAGRSDMTKAETIEAIIDAAESLSADPFSWVDVDLGTGGDREESAGTSETPSGDDTSAESEESEASEADGVSGDEANDDDADDAGASQLDAMMSLLDTHEDKWREADGDARYEVDLPDGDVETARTKDDVRALLFRNY
ncbi:hypothetical protein [Halorubrum sp. HHNYT27]|uniref:hypothetical protein n=1 Tax=Halorubrum sp. HHNYT27 TaxID=3402275 RepID=UPI003EB935C9